MMIHGFILFAASRSLEKKGKKKIIPIIKSSAYYCAQWDKGDEPGGLTMNRPVCLWCQASPSRKLRYHKASHLVILSSSRYTEWKDALLSMLFSFLFPPPLHQVSKAGHDVRSGKRVLLVHDIISTTHRPSPFGTFTRAAPPPPPQGEVCHWFPFWLGMQRLVQCFQH
ncbi:hypothetical protein BO94DRAFT_234690 [Aspergillus sclerotioniger CBS 115572]|uniref:Uncharacterized protein n=1 Tax=Aspergillus sclerotioniger CBS 115572 TaxID=1450535 RepID=A0A317VHK8_9EURO|nr:hypothetical protein BO94DRAFT_234690 [Aspergillus sclerotioniger CBS 115572]PWY73803.1 hypothetical protein BO94DRAFT_234690 [Aspergillus sclerotioniger CBS 115572]